MNSIRLFDNKQIRSSWNEEDGKWYFSVQDVIQLLTDSADVKEIHQIDDEARYKRAAKEARRIKNGFRQHQLSHGFSSVLRTLITSRLSYPLGKIAQVHTLEILTIMRKKHCYLIVFLLITLQSFAQQSKHVIDGKIIKASPTSADSMTLRIKQAAENYKVTSDSCLILSDYAFGDGQYEFTQLNGIGLLYFSIVTRDSIDIQKVRVYYERLDLKIGFQKIRYYAIPITDELTRIKVGDKRYDFYCFIQYSISQGIGDLNVKLGDTGKVVKIGSFPSKLKLDMSFDPKVGTTDPKKTISMPDLKHFLIREFGLFLER